MSSRSTQIIGGSLREHAWVDAATNSLLVKVVNPSSGGGIQYPEDSAHVSGDTGTMALVVRKDAAGTLVNADGDYAALQVDASGALRVVGGGGGIQYQEDSAHVSGDTGTMALVVRNDTPIALAGTDGDYAVLQVDATGRLRVSVDASVAIAATQSGAWTVTVNQPVAVTQSGAFTVGVNNFPAVYPVNDNGGSLTVDGTVAATQSGAWTVTVNQPVAVTQSGAFTVGVNNFPAVYPVNDNGGSLTVDGTVAATQSGAWTVTVNQPVAVTQSGTWNIATVSSVSAIIPGTGATNLGKAEDAPHASGDTGVMSLAVRNDSAAAGLSSATGDYEPLQMNSLGRLRSESTLRGSDTTLDYLADVIKSGEQTSLTTTKPSGFASIGEVVDGPFGSIIGDYRHFFLDDATSGLIVSVANLLQQEDTTHVSGHSGVMSLAVRQDTIAALATPTGDYSPLTVDAFGRMNVRTQRGSQRTYAASSTANFVAAAGAAMFAVFSGSATTTVTVQRITITGLTLTALAFATVVCEKWSTAPTGGTSVALVQVPIDSASAAGTMTQCLSYTVAPTEGTLVGTVASNRILMQAGGTAVAAAVLRPIVFDFRTIGEATGLVLRGSAQCLSLAFAAAPASGVTVSVCVEWTEI